MQSSPAISSERFTMSRAGSSVCSSKARAADWVRRGKVWPTVSRIDNVYGDRNLFCVCIPIEEYA